MQLCRVFLLIPVSLGAVPGTSAADTAESLAFFEREVRPLFAARCFPCHGSEKQENGLRLDSRESLLAGGLSGAVIVPGHPDQSLLVQAIRQSGDLKMPKDGRLTEAEVATLERWIQEGAIWPEAAQPSMAPRTMEERIAAAKKEHWAFQPLKPVAINPAGPIDPIDFLLQQAFPPAFRPTPPVDKRTLLRRATFDLTGLPPTPEEVEAFLEDTSPDAWPRVIERLLGSPRYGERWGRHWLDIVRYTDSFDSRATYEQDVAEAWRYRDWVVKSFNDDLPYDDFIRYQIAGDLLPPPDHPPAGFNREGIIATGVLAFGNWPGGDADKQKMLTDIVDDQIDVVMRGFLGMTFTCARCHDHKFDPFSTRDYYALAGMFFSSHIMPEVGPKTAGSPVLHIPLEAPEVVATREQHAKRLVEIETVLTEKQNQARKVFLSQELPRIQEYVLAAWRCFQAPQASLWDVAEATQVDAAALRRWVDLLGWTPYRLLTQPAANLKDKPGLYGLSGDADTPSVVTNSTAEAIAFLTIKQPPHSVTMHPGPATGVAVAWRSPLEGSVGVIARVADADPNCGEGIRWRIQHAHRAWPAETLLEGAIANGGEQLVNALLEAPRLQTLNIHLNDQLFLVIEPNNGHACDTTVVELQITELGGAERIWNLSTDISGDLQAGGNPHADSYGNAAVWEFVDLAGPAATPALTELSALQNLGADQSSFDHARVEAAAAALVLAAQQAPGSEPTPLQSFLSSERSPFWVALAGADPGDVRALKAELAQLRSVTFPLVEYANGVKEGGVPKTEHEGIHDVAVHVRGDYSRLGDVVPRGFPLVLAHDAQPAIREGSGRRELAEWVASEINPLTARVAVNRIWQHHFGQGIVRTPADFGYQGTRPTHPELLDYLAAEFIRSGWSVKDMHRLMMLSNAYQQSSSAPPEIIEKDPDNRYFARMDRKRLEAEALRDAMLAVNGNLDTVLGGPPFTDLLTPRRTLYFKTVRSDRTSYTMLFDAADPTSIIAQRSESLVAPQALFLLNHPFVVVQAENLAKQLLAEGPPPDAARIAWLYERLFARPPAEQEAAIGLQMIGAPEDEAQLQLAWTRYCQVLLSANEFLFVD
ncbi:MAG: PSD1 domain-containing protein [Candidatus Hydrogenedentes bacterium]|nr:PSD1 domain-containing protein [Candidatus Hydrogenedentota bacterium]